MVQNFYNYTMTEEQLKLCGVYHFRMLEDGVFHCIDQKFTGTPADLCAFFGVEVQCWTQFLRILNYEDAIHLEYRSYDSRTARVNIWEIKD